MQRSACKSGHNLGSSSRAPKSSQELHFKEGILIVQIWLQICQNLGSSARAPKLAQEIVFKEGIITVQIWLQICQNLKSFARAPTLAKLQISSCRSPIACFELQVEMCRSIVCIHSCMNALHGMGIKGGWDYINPCIRCTYVLSVSIT